LRKRKRSGKRTLARELEWDQYLGQRPKPENQARINAYEELAAAPRTARSMC